MKNYVISAVVSLFIGLVAFYLMKSSGGVKSENAGTVLMFSVVIAVFTVAMPLAFLAFRKLYANNKLFFWFMIVFASWFVALFFWFDAILLNALILGFVASPPTVLVFLFILIAMKKEKHESIASGGVLNIEYVRKFDEIEEKYNKDKIKDRKTREEKEKFDKRSHPKYSYLVQNTHYDDW